MIDVKLNIYINIYVVFLHAFSFLFSCSKGLILTRNRISRTAFFGTVEVPLIKHTLYIYWLLSKEAVRGVTEEA